VPFHLHVIDVLHSEEVAFGTTEVVPFHLHVIDVLHSEELAFGTTEVVPFHIAVFRQSRLKL
jgi:hypothetical protein